MTRSVVKANYIRLVGPDGAGARGRVKASANYYGHRPNQEGRREWRDAFSEGEDRLTKEESYEQVSGAEGEYAYRIVLSPGREMDDGELMEWVRGVMAMGEERGWFSRGRGQEEPDDWDDAVFGDGFAVLPEEIVELADFVDRWGENHYSSSAWDRHSEERHEFLDEYSQRLGVTYGYLENLTWATTPVTGEAELRALLYERENEPYGSVERYELYDRWDRGDREREEAPRWVGWAHTDHTDNPHVHVLAFTDRRLDVEDFETMRQEGDLACEQRLEWRAEVERDPMREEEQIVEERQERDGWDKSGDREPEERGRELEDDEQGVGL